MKKLLMLWLIFLVPATCFAAAATMYVTPTGAGAKDGATWASAMGYAEWEADMEVSTEAGDIYYVAGGTYTLTSDFVVANDGTATNPIKIIGVKSGTTNEPPVATDYAYTTDRPLITDGAGAYNFTFDNGVIVMNFYITGSDTSSISIDNDGAVINCKVTNDGAATRQAINLGGTGSIVVNCEASSTNGNAIALGASSRVEFCYLHDSYAGVAITAGDYCVLAFNVIDTVTIGVNNTADMCISTSISHNTIYGGGSKASGSKGISAYTGAYGWLITHNIITDFETGIEFDDTSSNTGYFDYNNIYDCTTDRTNTPTGINDIDANPSFTDASNGDFSLQPSSGCINAGINALGL